MRTKTIEYQVTAWLKGHCVGCDEASAESIQEIHDWYKRIVEELPYRTDIDRVYISALDIGESWDTCKGDYVEINEGARR